MGQQVLPNCIYPFLPPCLVWPLKTTTYLVIKCAIFTSYSLFSIFHAYTKDEFLYNDEKQREMRIGLSKILQVNQIQI